jgi:hypothetical protein
MTYCSHGLFSRLSQEQNMSFVYGGEFERIMNELCSPKNIAATAQKFAAAEKQYGSYAFGKFAKQFLPDPNKFAAWDKDSGGIPASIRHSLTEIISANLKSAAPLPVVLKVSENVDSTHELNVKVFVHKSQIYIGLHMLCPNTELK